MAFYRIIKMENVALIDILNDIEPSSAFVEDFKAIGHIDSIRLRVNSTGGDFAEAKKIYDTLVNHPAKKTGEVITFAGSSAVLILLACESVSIPNNAAILIHCPHTTLEKATAATLRQAAGALDEAYNFLVAVYKRKTNQTEDLIKTLLDNCTWMIGTEAHTLGFCNELTDPVCLVPIFDAIKFKRPDSRVLKGVLRTS